MLLGLTNRLYWKNKVKMILEEKNCFKLFPLKSLMKLQLVQNGVKTKQVKILNEPTLSSNFFHQNKKHRFKNAN